MFDSPTDRELQLALAASEHRAEGLQARLDGTQGILDAVSEAIYIQDAEGRFLDVNDGAARMYGYPTDFFIGKTPEVLSAPGRNDLEGVAKSFGKALLGEPQQFEFWGLKQNGDIFPKEVRVYPGTYLGQKVVIAIAQDISIRKRAEQTQEATYRIAEAALESRNIQDLFQRIHGIVRDLMPAENLYFALWDRASDLVSFPYWVDAEDPCPEPRRLRNGLTEFILRTGKPLLVDEAAAMALEASGEVEPFGTFSLDWMGVPLRGESGVFGAMVIQSYKGGYRYTTGDRDLLAYVSAQVAMAFERTRAEVERRVMTAAMDLAVDPVLGADVTGRFVFVNKATCASLGYSREELLRLSVWDINPQIDPEQWPARWARVRATGANREETRHRRRDGTMIPVEISSGFLAYEGQEVIFTNVRDITSRKAAEDAIRASEEKFSKAFQASPDAININRLDGTYVDCNPAFTRMSGWSREETLGRTTIELGMWAEPSDRDRMRQLLKAEGHFVGLEAGFRMKDGSIRTGLVSGTLLQVDGESCLLTITRDITDRKKTEEALTAERGLFVGGPVMVFKWRTTAGWPVDYASPNVESILGYPSRDLVEGRIPFRSLFHPEDLDRLIEEISDVETRGLVQFEQQYRLRTASGEYRWFYDFSVAAVPGPHPSHFLGYLLDITDRRQAEEALRQSQKLESLGILAGGIAHDFNNLLAVVLGNLNLAQMHLPEHAQAQPFLAKMEATVLRATELTKQMLAYSGRGHFVVEPQDLNQVVSEVTHLLEVSIPKKIRLRFELEPRLPAIHADAAQIQQVVMNLVTNASDAIGDREGLIHLSTSTAMLDERELQSVYHTDSLKAGPYVLLEVEDTGLGMSPEVMTRIFDPFFTTKATGRGLGLSAMLGILRGHGAGLRITSEEGHGSSFKICFPASDEQPDPCALGTEAASTQPLRGRILLVDDEDLILETIGSALKVLGLEVLTARDGLEALEKFREASPRPDLVLMDLTMPRMDGREAFRAMQDLDPSIPVVLSSGFSEGDAIETLSGHGPAAFMQKPYQVKELHRILQRLLGS